MHARMRSVEPVPRAGGTYADGALRPFASARMLEIGQLAQRAGANSRGRPRYIAIGQSASKRWIVKDDRGYLGAVFRSGETALRFARREASALGCKLMVSNSMELECLKA